MKYYEVKVDDINNMKLVGHEMIAKEVSIFHPINQSRRCIRTCFFTVAELVEMSVVFSSEFLPCAKHLMLNKMSNFSIIEIKLEPASQKKNT